MIRPHHAAAFARAAFILLLPCLMAGQAQAHAHLRQSSPAAGATLAPAPRQLDLYFSEGIEPAFSTVAVTGGDGSRVDAGLALAAGDAKHATVALKPLAPGNYHVVWHATATDTHRTQGAFDFSVAAGTQVLDFVVSQAWARPTIPTITVGAAYLAIANAGPADDRLVGADTPVAARAELHASETQGDTATMKPLADVAVPAGGRVVFKPLDKHVMLVGLKAPLVLGTHFPLTLHFSSGAAIVVDVAVTRAAPSPSTDDHDDQAMKGMKM